MASNASIEVVVLWEHELRAAAEAIGGIQANSQDKPDEFVAQVMRAVNACSAALAGVAESPDTKLILLGNDAIKHDPREIMVKQLTKKKEVANG